MNEGHNGTNDPINKEPTSKKPVNESPANGVPASSIADAILQQLTLLQSFLSVAKETLVLLDLECRLALHQIPHIFWLTLLSPLLLLLAWTSSCAAIAWHIGDVYQNASVGLLVFSALQVLGYIVSRQLLAYRKRRASLPETRAFLGLIRPPQRKSSPHVKTDNSQSDFRPSTASQ